MKFPKEIVITWEEFDNDEPCMVVHKSMDIAVSGDDGPTKVAIYKLVEVKTVSKKLVVE